MTYKKSILYIFLASSLFCIAFGITYKANAFDLISSPTGIQNGSISSQGFYLNGNIAVGSWDIRNASGTVLYAPPYPGTSSAQLTSYRFTKVRDYDVFTFDCGHGYCDSYDSWLILRGTGSAIQIGGTPQFFLGSGTDGNEYSVISGANVVKYVINPSTMSLGSPVSTVAKPSSGFAVKYGTIPVPINGPSSTFFVYQGSDSKSYSVDSGFGAGNDIPMTDAGTGYVDPIGALYSNDFIASRQSSSLGPKYIGDSSVTSTNIELQNDYELRYLNSFVNPKAYFTTSSGYVVSWDMNCDTPYYNTCVYVSGSYKCGSSTGSLSPNGETCGTAMTSLPGTVPSSGAGGSTSGTTFSQNGLVCSTVNYPSFSSTPYSIGNATFSDNSSGATLPDRYSFRWLSTDGSYRDQFSVYPSTGLYADTDTFTGGINAGKTTTIYSDIDQISAGNPTSLSVSLTRSGQTSVVNYVKIKTQNQGFSPLNSNQKNIVADVRFNGLDGQVHTYPLVYSGGYATALSRFPSNHINIQFTTGTVTFDGFEIGYSNSGTIAKTSCKNSAFSCQYTQQSPGVFTCDSALNVSGIPQGECEVVGTSCQPKANIVPYYDGAVVPGGAVEKAINASGATVGLNYAGEDIFTCTESGLGVLICPIQIVSKVWGKFTTVIQKLVNLIYGVSSLGSPSGVGNIFSFVFPTAYADSPGLSTPFDISGSGSSSNSYTGADMMGLNRSILKSSDNTFSMDSGGIKGIYAFSMWTLILVGIVVVIVVFLIAFA